MDPERKTQILTFVRNQIAQSQILLKTLVLDPQGGKLPYIPVVAHFANNLLEGHVVLQLPLLDSNDYNVQKSFS